MWSIYKLGRGRFARVEHILDLPEEEAKAHAELLNKRFAPEYVYWVQPLPPSRLQGAAAVAHAGSADARS